MELKPDRWERNPVHNPLGTIPNCKKNQQGIYGHPRYEGQMSGNNSDAILTVKMNKKRVYMHKARIRKFGVQEVLAGNFGGLA